jgi:small subunit ribosomal protein S8
MAMTDPIADMLTRIRNANMVAHDSVEVPASRIKVALTKILREEGYIKHYKIVKTPMRAAPKKPLQQAAAPPPPPPRKSASRQGFIRIYLKYGPNRERVINGLTRLSRPGRRAYVGAANVPDVCNGLGVAILSTPKGVMSGRSARQQNVGGELLAKIW